MNKLHSERGEDPDAVERFLREVGPAELPLNLRQNLFVRMEESRRRSIRVRLWLAAAAILVTAVPLGFWWAGAGGESKETAAELSLLAASALEDEPNVNAADDVLETTDVVALQDAGTTPTQSGAYRIVLVTFVHRMWDAAGDAPDARVLSERTSQSYVAVPLEIF